MSGRYKCSLQTAHVDVNTVRDEAELGNALLGDATLKGAAIFQVMC